MLFKGEVWELLVWLYFFYRSQKCNSGAQFAIIALGTKLPCPDTSCSYWLLINTYQSRDPPWLVLCRSLGLRHVEYGKLAVIPSGFTAGSPLRMCKPCYTLWMVLLVVVGGGNNLGWRGTWEWVPVKSRYPLPKNIFFSLVAVGGKDRQNFQL